MQRIGDPILGRQVLLANNDLRIARVNPAQQQQAIYRNAGASELLFISSGSGVLKSMFGVLPYRQYDYISIPQGTAYLLEADDIQREAHLIIESPSLIRLPQRYLNSRGQLKLGAPIYERDLHAPDELCCIDEEQETDIICKQGSAWSRVRMAHHPFDAVGWDGFVYPFTFNALDFEPITGLVHQPPPVHQCFEAAGFVVCTFVPRYLDHHPDAIKVPFAHSNVMMDEMLYYVDGNFSSRKGIGSGSITMHPRGLVHGPHPGTLDAADDAVRADELAVMVDTANPLQINSSALKLLDTGYPASWMESP
jgi:homogentisate 1,2-dioxygenase